MPAFNFSDDHVGRLAITFVVLVAWFVLMMAKPAEGEKTLALVTLVVGHYFGREGGKGEGGKRES